MATSYFGRFGYNGKILDVVIYDSDKIKDVCDVWISKSPYTNTDTAISYKQIANYCEKLTPKSSEALRTNVVFTSTSQKGYLIITPKGAVEEGSSDITNFVAEMTRLFKSISGNSSIGTNNNGWKFHTTNGEPYLAYCLSSYSSSYNVYPSLLGGAGKPDYVQIYFTATPQFEYPAPPVTGSVTVSNVLENCVSDVADGTVYEEGADVSITLTANPSYEFSELDPPTVYYDTNYGGTTRTMVVSEDKKHAYATTDSEGLNNLIENGVMVITATAYAIGVETPTATVSASLSNCTASEIPETVAQGQEVSIEFTPSDGFEFKTAPTASYLDGSGTAHVLNGTFTAESASIVIQIEDLGNGTEILITAGASEMESDDFSCAVVLELDNATIEPEITEIANGANVSIKLTPSDTAHSFIDSDQCYLEYVDGSGQTQKVFGYYDGFHYYRTISVDAISLQKDSIVKVHAKAYFGSAEFDYSNLVHCTAQEQYIAYDEEFAQTTHVQHFVADDGYFFNGTVSFDLKNANGTSFQLNASFDNDRTVASITIPNNMQLEPNSKITANAVAIAREKQFDISTIFLPTAKQIYDLSQQRYYTLSQSQGDYISLEQIDLGQYILSLRKMFVNLPSADVQSIILGFYNTDITASTFEGIKHSVSCGQVHVSGVYGNSLDFTNSMIEVALPFVGIKTLEADKVMNRDLELVYDVNVSAGECVARIVDAESEQELYAFNGVCAYDIPYILEYSLGKAYQIPENDLSVANLCLYHVTPTITIRENDIVSDERSFGDNTAIFTQMENLSGYNEIDNVNLDGVSCTAEEMEMIRSALRNGVYLPEQEEAV